MSTAIILFAKAPVLGKVKTRLIARLGAQGALSLYEQMLERQIERFSRYCQKRKGEQFYFYLSGDLESNYAKALSTNSALRVYPQVGDDLGERMYLAIKEQLARHEKVILFGGDCPFIDEQVVDNVDTKLNDNPLVFVPAMDGGYVLIGATDIKPDIFKLIDWSTQRVMAQTRERIKALAWSHEECEALADIDEADDLERLDGLNFRFSGFLPEK